MTPQQPTHTPAAADFEHRWKAWCSDTGQWWATRADPLTAAERTAGCVHYLRATTPGELCHLIDDQEQLQATTQP